MAKLQFKDLPFTGDMHEGACKNHPKCQYLTKGPGRGLHYTPENVLTPECSCPIEDIEFEVDTTSEILSLLKPRIW